MEEISSDEFIEDTGMKFNSRECDTTDDSGTTVSHFGDPAYFESFEQVTEGKMSPEEFNQFVRDLVNFLDWAATPEQLERQRLGIWVIIFLFVFLLFSWLLKKEIWNDVE